MPRTRPAPDLSPLEERLGYCFDHPDLLRTALTHSSFANEQDGSQEHNERLEFLGDAVIELCVSQELYTRYPQAREGELTSLRARLVSEGALAAVARELGLQSHLRLGRGEESQGGRERDAVLCDALESICGAVFLDRGFQAAREVISRLLACRWPKSLPSGRRKDFKSRLQELTQRRFKDRPRYILRQSLGPEHAKTYVVDLCLPDGRTFQAEASSVKKAEQMAASQALQSLEA